MSLDRLLEGSYLYYVATSGPMVVVCGGVDFDPGEITVLGQHQESDPVRITMAMMTTGDAFAGLLNFSDLIDYDNMNGDIDNQGDEVTHPTGFIEMMRRVRRGRTAHHSRLAYGDDAEDRAQRTTAATSPPTTRSANSAEQSAEVAFVEEQIRAIFGAGSCFRTSSVTAAPRGGDTGRDFADSSTGSRIRREDKGTSRDHLLSVGIKA